jgi:dienelactone hydrolase
MTEDPVLTRQTDKTLHFFFLAAVWCTTAAVNAGDVAWLAEVTTPPASQTVAEGNTKALAPLLIDATGQPITTQVDWEKQRQLVRDEWLKFLGPMPAPRPAVVLEVLKVEQCGQFDRSLVRYEGEPGVWVEGYLLVPHGATQESPRPGVIALHATTTETIDGIAGLTGPANAQIGKLLAERGFVVFCPRCFLWQDATDYDQAVAHFRQRHPDTRGMAKMLYDAMRAVDVLESLPYVDKQRLASVGHSLGAKETLYLAAFDERIKAAVASEGGITLPSTNWDASWYLGPAIHDATFRLNHHQLLALIAPRPFLVLGGETGPGAADGDRSWPLIEAAAPVWKLYDAPIRLGLYNHHQGHSLSPESFARMAEWLSVYLHAAPTPVTQ